ncbi:hypothetical protein MID00_17720 [Alcaligenes sp. NLF5-7]|uniref:hypothetical protein n=1 Tax=Alcaligenes sp. NLF5-7 TaxID=2918755 RepID=UPI0020C30B23|nr:hypothetical protein [Alcaligenes sp. NLF5-7]UTM01304.1 hypothetical protein MID00_17720 [Alcaligenes sp. NLF5-7]
MKISTASILAIAITLASTNATLAQTSMNLKDDTTDHLRWRPMAIASFNYGRINVPDVSRADMNLARTVWNKEINSAPLDDDGTKLPSFILVSSVTNQGVQYTFSIFSSAGTPGCVEPGNGSGIEDMYETCPLRVTEFQGSQSHTQEFQNYCHLYPFPPDHPGDVNQTEFAFDEKNMTAHFRVIQHGKHVPACDRKLTLR